MCIRDSSTTQYARSYISEGAAVTDGLALYLDADDWGSYPGTKTLTGKFTEYSSGSSHYRTMGRNGVVLLGTSTSWIGYFSADPSSTGRHTIMFDYWSDVAQSNSLVLDNDGIEDNQYNATLSTQTYRQTRFENFTHTTTGNIKFYFRNNAAGNKVYVDNVRFFKADDTWNDLSGNGNDGTISGATPAIDSSAGLCFDFDGTNDYINFGNISDTQFQHDDNFSLLIWFKTDSTSGFNHLIGKTYGNYRFAHDGSTLSFRLDSNNLIVTGGTVVIGTWHCAVATWNGSTKTGTVFLDGVQAGQGTDATVNWTSTTADFQLGNSYGESYYFDGKIAASQVYSKTLSAAEVKQNFNSERNRFGV